MSAHHSPIRIILRVPYTRSHGIWIWLIVEKGETVYSSSLTKSLACYTTSSGRVETSLLYVSYTFRSLSGQRTHSRNVPNKLRDLWIQLQITHHLDRVTGMSSGLRRNAYFWFRGWASTLQAFIFLCVNASLPLLQIPVGICKDFTIRKHSHHVLALYTISKSYSLSRSCSTSL